MSLKIITCAVFETENNIIQKDHLQELFHNEVEIVRHYLYTEYIKHQLSAVKKILGLRYTFKEKEKRQRGRRVPKLEAEKKIHHKLENRLICVLLVLVWFHGSEHV